MKPTRSRRRIKPATVFSPVSDVETKAKLKNNSNKRRRAVEKITTKKSKRRVASTATSNSNSNSDKKENTNGKAKNSKNIKETKKGSKQSSRSQRSSSPSSDTSSETTTSRGSSSRKSIPLRIDKLRPNHRVPFSFCFNLAFDPWIEYSFNLVADRGMNETQWTSFRLRKEAFYLETEFQRYELKLNDLHRQSDESMMKESQSNEDGEMHDDILIPKKSFESAFCKYTWSRVKSPEKLDNATMEKLGCPLPEQYCIPIDENLDWNQIQWGSKYIQVNNKVYNIKCIHFAFIAK